MDNIIATVTLISPLEMVYTNNVEGCSGSSNSQKCSKLNAIIYYIKL